MFWVSISIVRIFHKEETFGLTSQLRRAAVSIAANIAEGFKKKGKPDKVCFMNIAPGSPEESRYYLVSVYKLQSLVIPAIPNAFGSRESFDLFDITRQIPDKPE